MKILKLANQSGITVTKKSNNDVSYEYLADFAQAVIEDYKAGLVPVAFIYRGMTGQISLQDADGDFFDMSKHIGKKLYALPLGETK